MLTLFLKLSSTVSPSWFFTYFSPPLSPHPFRLHICFSDPDTVLSSLSKYPFIYLFESRGKRGKRMGFFESTLQLISIWKSLLLWGEALNALKRVPSEWNGKEEVFFSINKGKKKFAYKVETDLRHSRRVEGKYFPLKWGCYWLSLPKL